MVLRYFPLMLLALGGCEDAAAPEPLPPHAVALEPAPAAYETWWAEIESCSGRTRPMSAVAWYYVPFGYPLTIHGEDQVAVWLAQPDRIVILQSVIDLDVIVRHEMLHAILQRGDHPPLYFETRCGDLVS